MFRVYPPTISHPAFGDQAMDMVMENERLTPGVQCRYDSRLCPDMPLIKKELKQAVPNGNEEYVRHPPHVQYPNIVKLMGNGEDHMIMGAAEQSLILFFEPLLKLKPIALRADAMFA
jgi:hypothetical protein